MAVDFIAWERPPYMRLSEIERKLRCMQCGNRLGNSLTVRQLPRNTFRAPVQGPRRWPIDPPAAVLVAPDLPGLHVGVAVEDCMMAGLETL